MSMEPVGWLGDTLIHIGNDGRYYFPRRRSGWFARWWHRELPKLYVDADGVLCERLTGDDNA